MVAWVLVFGTSELACFLGDFEWVFELGCFLFVCFLRLSNVHRTVGS